MTTSFETAGAIPGSPAEFQHFQPVRNGFVEFRVRAGQSAGICLSAGPTADATVYEVVLGDRNNTITAIIGEHEVSTPDIVSATEFRDFWINFDDRCLQVGRDQVGRAFLECVVDKPLSSITHVGFRTGCLTPGSWCVDIPYQPPPPPPVASPPPRSKCHMSWKRACNGNVPAGAVAGGEDRGNKLYVARAHHCGGLLPGKLISKHEGTYVAWRGREHLHYKYEVLCTTGCHLSWVATRDGQAVAGAVVGGYTERGETLYVGRAMVDECLTLGKVQRSHGVCYIPYNNLEYKIHKYEELVAE